MTQPRTALFLSPHLDDVAFSCGGLAGVLADAGWRTVLATLFTRSVVPATGFALACQLDKGLGPEVDYMALRRDEDARAAQILNFSAVRWMDLLEAPHRGYASPPQLFGEQKPEDNVATEVLAALTSLRATHSPNLVLSPQSLGNHVDHRIVTACAQTAFSRSHLAYYRDTPYIIRNPDAVPVPGTNTGAHTIIDISAALPRKIAASAAYATQIPYQFGSDKNLTDQLTSLARAEAQNGGAAERFSGCAIRL